MMRPVRMASTRTGEPAMVRKGVAASGADVLDGCFGSVPRGIAGAGGLVVRVRVVGVGVREPRKVVTTAG
jgi:hypothetical protein